jgi:hypothetical protein
LWEWAFAQPGVSEFHENPSRQLVAYVTEITHLVTQGLEGGFRTLEKYGEFQVNPNVHHEITEEEVREAYRKVEYTKAQLDFLEETALYWFKESRDGGNPSLALAVSELEVAIKEARGLWSQIPIDLRRQYCELAPGEVVELVSMWRDSWLEIGLQEWEPTEGYLEPKESYSISLELGEEDFPVEVVAYSLGDLSDIDLYASNPGGEVLFLDESADSYPMIEIAEGDPGEWIIELVNATEQSCAYRLHVFTPKD